MGGVRSASGSRACAIQRVARILRRLTRVRAGLWGDARPVGAGVLELREHYGPGYRVYCARHGAALVILLAGGDKGSQRRDIEHAKRYWKDWQGQEGG